MSASNPGYRDRSRAGAVLGRAVTAALPQPPQLVLALPRGGVPVGVEVARATGAVLDVLVVRKIGVPGHRELAMGAIAAGGVRVLNPEVLAGARVDPREAEAVVAEEQAELDRRARAYRGDRPPLALEGRRVLIVDDGLATGATMAAAVEVARRGGAAGVDAAVPVGPPSALARLSPLVGTLVCPLVPERFVAVGWWYADFGEVGDGAIRAALGTTPA